MSNGPIPSHPNDHALVVNPQPIAYAPVLQPPSIRPARRRNQEPDMNAGFLWSAWCRWWKVLVPVSLLMAVLTSGLVLLITVPVYRAEAYLEIRQNKDHLMTPVTRDEANRAFVQTQIEYLRSPVVLSKITGKVEVAKLPQMKRNDNIKWLSEHLEIISKDNSEFFKVAVTTSDRQASATLVNAVVDTYVQLYEDKEQESNDVKIRKLEELRKQKQELVQRKQEVLEKLLNQMDPSTPTPLDRRMVLDSNPLSDLQKELRESDISISMKQAEIEGIKESLGKERRIERAAILEMVENDLDMVVQKKSLNDKRDRLAQIEATLRGGASNSRFQKYQQDIASQERRVNTLRANLTKQYENQFAIMAQARQQDKLDGLEQELRQERVKRDHLEQQLLDRKKNMKESSDSMTEIEFAQHEYDQARELLARMSQRLAELQTEAGAEGRVKLVEPAAVPSVAEPMGLWKKLLGAILASAALPFGVAVLFERAACRITSTDQLENQIELPVIGEVARLPIRITSNGRTRNASARSLAMFEESIDSIRTSLLLQKEQEHLQVIAICSSVASEGKTSVSSQLAISLARATGQPTLLIDGDMRAPDLHGVFEIPNEPGLVRVLDGEATLQGAINRDWSEHIHILPAGEIHKSPHKLLGQMQFQRLLDEVRTQYRYIIVDTPPILAASEALIMAAAADGVLVCAMQEKSRGGNVRMTYERLVSAGAKPIGTILNGVSTRSYAYKYGSYYGDGKHYAYTRT